MCKWWQHFSFETTKNPNVLQQIHQNSVLKCVSQTAEPQMMNEEQWQVSFLPWEKAFPIWNYKSNLVYAQHLAEQSFRHLTWIHLTKIAEWWFYIDVMCSRTSAGLAEGCSTTNTSKSHALPYNDALCKLDS